MANVVCGVCNRVLHLSAFLCSCGDNLCRRCARDRRSRDCSALLDAEGNPKRNRVLLRFMREVRRKQQEMEEMKEDKAALEEQVKKLKEEKGQLEMKMEEQKNVYEERISDMKKNAELKEKVYQLTAELAKRNE